MTKHNYLLYRKMSLDEYGGLSTSGLTMNKSGTVALCPKKCLSESLIATYRLNPYRNALSQIIAEFSFPMEVRTSLLESGLELSKPIHSDRIYSGYKKYEGTNIFYRCHGSQITLYSHELEAENIRELNDNIIDVKRVNPDNYPSKLLEEYFGVSDFENLSTRRELDRNEYYIQLPDDFAILALQFKAIPSGGLNRFIKSRFISRNYDELDQMNREIFPVTLAIRLDKDTLTSRIEQGKISEGLYAISANMMHSFNKGILGVRFIEYRDERAHYKYASDTLNNKMSISDILNDNIRDEGFSFEDYQVNLAEALNLINNSPLKEYFVSMVTNINENLYIPSDYHGKTHAERVCLLAFLIATHMGLPEKDIKLLIQTSLLHDVGRTSECDDDIHGYNGAKKIDELALFIDDEKSKNVTQFLIEAHALELDELTIASLMKKYNVDNNKTNLTLLNILMDADALDRARFTVFEDSSSGLNPEYLRIPFSKRLISLSKLMCKSYYNNSGMVLKKTN